MLSRSRGIGAPPARLSRLRAAVDRFAQRLRREESGVAAVEFGLFAPMLLVLLLGGVDVTRFVLVRNKVAKVGFAMSDVAAQYKQIGAEALKQIWLIPNRTMPAFVTGTTGVTVLTAVGMDASSVYRVTWQCYSTNGTAWASKVGSAGTVANIPAGLLIDDNDNVIVAEVFFKFEPMFKLFYARGFDIYSKGMFRPRLGTLTTKPC